MSEEQLRGLREALAHSPDNPPLMRLLAAALADAGRYGEAEDAWRALVTRQPSDLEARLGLARCYFAVGKDKPAAVVCEEILSEVSDHAQANLLLARCRYRLGDLAEAGTAYRAAKTRDGAICEPALEDLLDTPVSELSEDGLYQVERPATNFAQVGGMEAVKEDVRMKIIHPLAHPDLFRAYGKAAGGGLLLYGPPGCGKTHLARATAGEVDAHFMSVGITDILDIWIGSSESNLAQVFAQARSHTPCVLFFDEVDALAANRRDLRQSAGRQVINQFLAELDGIDALNDGLLVMAATNAPWHLDPAFRRPGRFDKVLFVPPPDTAARAAILRVLLAGKPTEQVDVERIAAKTAHFSGADLLGVIDRATETRLRAALASGRPEPLRTKDLMAQVKQSRPTTREWLASARNHAMYANQDGVYDDVLAYLDIKK